MPTGSERLIWGQGAASTLRAITTEIKGVRLTMGSAICWENYMPLLRQSLYAQNVNLWFAPTADARDAWASLMRTVACEGRCAVISSNQCTKKKHLPEWISKTGNEEALQSNKTQVDEGVANNPSEQPNRSGRRKSTITKTEEGHEIILPDSSISNGTSAIDSSSYPESESQGLSPKQPSFTTTQSSSTDGEEFVCRGGSMIVSPLGNVVAGPAWEKEDELLIAEVDFADCERGRLDLDVAGSYSRSDSFRLSVEGLDLNPPPF